MRISVFKGRLNIQRAFLICARLETSTSSLTVNMCNIYRWRSCTAAGCHWATWTWYAVTGRAASSPGPWRPLSADQKSWARRTSGVWWSCARCPGTSPRPCSWPLLLRTTNEGICVMSRNVDRFVSSRELQNNTNGNWSRYRRLLPESSISKRKHRETGVPKNVNRRNYVI